MSIQERQNKEESIRKLASQRLLYSRAKLTRSFKVGLILLVSLLGLASSTLENTALSQWIPLVVLIVWTADQLILKKKENSLKTEAAVVQEDFDCYVLDLDWPEHKAIERPTPDRLRQLSRKALRKSNGSVGLFDWYSPGEIPREPIHAKIHCQKMSCWWDTNLRLRWKNMLYVALVSFVCSALILCYFNDITVARLTAIFASILGVLSWTITEKYQQEESGQRIERLHRHLENLSQQETISPSSVRSVQDEIFEHRRSSPLIPDWFYRLNRNDQESEVKTNLRD